MLISGALLGSVGPFYKFMTNVSEYLYSGNVGHVFVCSGDSW